MPKVSYRVFHSTEVDRPERRGPTYPVVRAGHVIHTIEQTESYKAAMTIYEEIRGGVYDFGSEYVCSVWVQRVTEEGADKRYRCVRKRAIRERHGDKVVEVAQV